MNANRTTKTILNIMINLFAIAILGTLGCSGSTQNPVGTDINAPVPMTSDQAPSLDNESAGREAQIFFYEYPEVEPNNEPATAQQVFHAQLINGQINSTTDINDYYKIQVSLVPASIYVKVEWTSVACVNLYIYDQDQNPVQYLNAPDPSPKELFCYQLNPGTYYIRVKGTHNPTDYRIKFGVGRQFNETVNDTIETTTLEWINDYAEEPFRSVVSASEDRNDYMKIVVPEDDMSVKVKLDWVGLASSNLNVYLYHADYSPIVYSNGTACPEAFQSAPLPAGTYYIRIKAAVGEGIYELTVSMHDILMPKIPWNLYEIPKWIPPFPPCLKDKFPFPGNPDAYLIDEIPPLPIQGKFYFNHSGYKDQFGNDLELPQMPEFGY